MSRSEIIELLGSDWTRMTELIRSALSSDVRLLQDVNDGLSSHSGKLLRPMLSLLMAKAIGTPNGDSVRYAAACELLHNATLIHDDVADESSERRGYPTVSAILGPSAAVLVGDFWLARAVEMVLSTGNYGRVVGFFSKTLTDLAEGEMFQMEKASSGDTDEEDYLRIIRCKTGSLFEAAGVAAACSVGASDEMFEAARRFSSCFGTAFQIKDDILDYAGTDALGKPVGADVRGQKITLPLIGAFRAAGAPAEAEIRKKMLGVHSHPEYCDQIRDFVLEYDGIAYAAGRLDEYIDRALDALSVLPDSPAKEALAEIARYNAYREI